MDFWRVTFTGEPGESAVISVKFNGNEVHPDSDTSLPWNVVILNNPTGTVEASAMRNDAGRTGTMSAQISANGLGLASDSDSGPSAHVSCSATR